MPSKDLMTAARATSQVSVTRAALSSYNKPGVGAVASLLVLEHHVAGNRHETVVQVGGEWLLCPFAGTLPELAIVVEVYRRMAEMAQAKGAHELHVEFPSEVFRGEKLTIQNIRDFLAVPETLALHVYALHA